EGLSVGRVAGHFHRHRHRQDDDGVLVPRRVRQTGCHGGTRLPAGGEAVGAHLARYDGRDAEGHCSVPQRAAADDYDGRQATVGGAMALSRRKFVSTVGIGAGAALTSSIWGRGRENSVWSAFEPRLEAVDRGVICIASNENPVGPGKKVLDAVHTILEGSGAKPGRYSNQAGELTEAI